MKKKKKETDEVAKSIWVVLHNEAKKIYALPSAA